MTWQARLRRADFVLRALMLAAIAGLLALVLAALPHEREVEAGGILQCGSVLSPGASGRAECADALRPARYVALAPASIALVALLAAAAVRVTGDE